MSLASSSRNSNLAAAVALGVAAAIVAAADPHPTLATGLGCIALVLLALLCAAYLSVRKSRDEARAENRSLAEAKERLERTLQARTEFLATTSHEIRTPLNGILGMTQLILHDPKVDGVLRNRVELVQGAGERMRMMVDGILDMTKLEAGEIAVERSETDLNQVLAETVQLWSAQAQQKGLAVELDCPPGTRVLIDELRVRQILSNLLANAIKFTPQGKVRLAVDTEHGAEGERLLIRIKDSGIGIAPDRIDRIFERFDQGGTEIGRRYGGTGLGLSICRALARAMGGDVTAQSRPGEGSVFLLALPLERVSAAAPGKIADSGGTTWPWNANRAAL